MVLLAGQACRQQGHERLGAPDGSKGTGHEGGGSLSEPGSQRWLQG